MKFSADITIMPLPEILDPQGKAVLLGLHNLEFDTVQDVRVGKHVRLVLEAASRQEAEEKVDTACRKLLANPIMEKYSFSLQEVEEAAV